jgi:exodeoxyribonuclease V gamma subunit
MIHLHYSNRLEELIGPMADVLGTQQRRDPLLRIVVVVPNRIIQEFLKLRLAESIGVAANLEFPFLRRYLARLVAAADSARGMLEADELELVIFECLRDGVARGEPQLRAAADYASAGSDRSADREMRLFELSVRTAHLFREYAISRTPMLARWHEGPAPGLDSMRAAERWQRHVYLSLFGHDGRLSARWIDGEKSLYFMPSAALAAIAPQSLAAALNAPLHVFGLSYAGPEFVRIFAQIGQATDLHIYALNPCMEFWEDIDNSYRGTRERLARRGQKVGGALESTEDPFGLDGADDNLALALWGKPGREYIRLLNELTECDFDAHFKHSLVDAQPGSLLSRVQEAILCREPRPTASAQRDQSIRFLACPGIRREVEIIADSIWSLIRNDEKGATNPALRFHQIALLIADSELDSYLPHVETVFAQRFQIPLNIVDRPFGVEGRALEAVQLLLELPKGHFNRDAVLHLVTHPAIVGDSAIDTGQWEQWCRSTGVFFGADETELAATYIPPNHYHWDQALKRLALGVFMGKPEAADGVMQGPDGREYLPCETAQDELTSVATLIASVRRMLADAMEVRERRLPMATWARVLSDLVRTYVRPVDPAGRSVADYCVGAIESMALEGLRGGPVSYQVACARALECIGTAQAEQGRYAESGVAVGSFSALRSIPLRVIFALGLGETIFPQRDRRDLLDLRSAGRRAGDVSPSHRDRYMFLETLLAARERVIFSWVARDALTGQKLDPSPLIHELRLVIGRYLDQPEVEKLTITHPASSYDLRYFPDVTGQAPEEGLINFDPNARHAARMRALRADLEHACGGIPPDDQSPLEMVGPAVRTILEPALRIVQAPVAPAPSPLQLREIQLSLSALRKYLECPLQGAAQYALGMVDDDDAGDEDAENEPLTQTRLDSVALLRDAFWEGKGDIEAARRHFDRALRIHQLAGRAPVGPFADAVSGGFATRMQLCIEQAQALKIGSLAGWERIRIGGAAEEVAHADRILPAIAVDIGVPRAGATMTVRIGLRALITVSPQHHQSINCIARNSGSRTGDFLSGFLAAIMLAAAGENRARSFEAVVLGGADDGIEPAKLIRSLPAFSRDQALNYLTALAEDIFSAKNHYFLPIEAVEEIVKRKEGKKWPNAREITERIEILRENEFGPCRSDYGPVRNPRDYPVPPPAQVIAIIERRFVPIISIFGR